MIRYAVYGPNQSPLCAMHTPAYFRHGEYSLALALAQKHNTQVIDLWKE